MGDWENIVQVDQQRAQAIIRLILMRYLFSGELSSRMGNQQRAQTIMTYLDATSLSGECDPKKGPKTDLTIHLWDIPTLFLPKKILSFGCIQLG